MAQKDLNTALQELSAQEKQQLANACIRYHNAKVTGGDVQSAYSQLWYMLKGIEQKCNTTIFVPVVSDQKLIDKITEKMIQKLQDPAPAQAPAQAPVQAPAQAPVQARPVTPQVPAQQPTAHYTCVFQSLEEANRWLGQQRNVTITNLQVETSRVGLDITRIRLEYRFAPQSYQYPYQLTELKKNRFFAQSKPQKVREKWEKDNPSLRCLTAIKRTWGFSLFGGHVGYFRYIKEKYIILYTAKVA